MKGMRWLAIVALSMLACTRPQVQAAPAPETLITVDQLRHRLPADSVDLLIINGVPIMQNATVDSLPSAEVVSAYYLPTARGCSDHGNGTCRLLILERCDDGTRKGRQRRNKCPWVVSQAWDGYGRSR